MLIPDRTPVERVRPACSRQTYTDILIEKARCNFEKPTCGYCRAFGHACSYTAAAACANRRNAYATTTLHRNQATNASFRKKLSIETKRQQRPSLPTRKPATGSFKQPYSADATSPSGYLTPVTPLERRLHSAGAGYHSRVSDSLGSPITANRSVYSPDSTSPSIPLSRKNPIVIIRTRANTSAINGHGAGRYQPQQVRPYGQSTSGYVTDPRGMVQKVDAAQRSNPGYVAVPLMDHQSTQLNP